MDLGLKDKVVIVAASSAGLGKATAMAFAKEGAKVVITGRDAERLKQAKEEITGVSTSEVLLVQMDVTRADDINKLVDTGIEHFATVHVLVNNAGGATAGIFLGNR